MTFKNLRVVLVAALVAALLGTGVATAKSLIKSSDIASNAVTSSKIKNSSVTGSDIKNSSIKSADVKNGSLSIRDLTKATQNLIRSGGTSSTSGKPGTNGSTGGAGATGPQGPKGDTGASGDPTPNLITGANWRVKGFGRWRDADSTSTIAFGTDGLTVGSTNGRRYGVNFPIESGTRVEDLAVVKYRGNATFALEVNPSGDGGTGTTGVTYATWVFVPTSTDATVTHDVTTEAGWYSTKAVGSLAANDRGKTLAQLLAAANTAPNVDDHARILYGRVGGGSTDGTAAESKTVSGIDIQAKGAPDNTYVFSK